MKALNKVLKELNMTLAQVEDTLKFMAIKNKKIQILLNYSEIKDWNPILIEKIPATIDAWLKEIKEETLKLAEEDLVATDTSEEVCSEEATERNKIEKEEDIDLTDEEKYWALEAGGVDNWSYFGDAIEDTDWDDLTDEQRFWVLWNAGVDNWEFYYDSIEYFKEEMKTSRAAS